MALDDNARSVPTNATYGAPMFVYKLTSTGIHTNHTDSDSNFQKILSYIGQRTTVLAWETPASGVAYVLCEGGIDLSTWPLGAGATTTAGTIDDGDTGASADCVITKHLTFE
tara:strand:- start:146 stop:481 length:336 start_codon:yes stop_codon:yes gene_type:complete